MMQDSVLAWHFVRDGWKLRDGANVVPGMITVYTGPLRMCQSGLHASTHLIDALGYAPSPLLERVRCSNGITNDTDKLVCRERVTLWTLDAEWYLHEFACQVAELAIKWSKRPGDPRSLAAIAAKRAWLRGEISDKELAAARAAARDAAWAAAGAAARAAAGAAAWDAAGAAAWDAAGDAAGVATWAVAWDAARDSLNRKLTRLVMSAEWEE